MTQNPDIHKHKPYLPFAVKDVYKNLLVHYAEKLAEYRIYLPVEKIYNMTIKAKIYEDHVEAWLENGFHIIVSEDTYYVRTPEGAQEWD